MPQNRRELGQLASASAERRQALLEEVRRVLSRVREEPYESIAGAVRDIGDEAVADLIADVDQAEVTRDLGELRELEAALKRIADGAYGLCVDCGDDIAIERLRAQPGAPRCVGCQQRHEKTYRT